MSGAPRGREVQGLEEIVTELHRDVVRSPVTYNPELYNKRRREMVGMMPKSQAELPPRRMGDSLDTAAIPLGSDPRLRDRYLTVGGGVRIGRILEDMDIFAVHLVFKHVVNPRQGPGLASPLSIVTAMVDSIDWTKPLRCDADIRMSGHVSWVGGSSAEVSLELEQEIEGVWVRCTQATFVMVARDPLNRTGSFVNPLEVVTREEEEVFQRGIENKTRRISMNADSLFKVPPTLEEQLIIHNLFITTVDHRGFSFKARVKPDNSCWFEEANLKNLIVCQPDNRNIYNKIYGGFIMRQAFELAWANTFVFCKSRPTVLHMDDILFRRPVEVGAMLYFNSQVCYTQGNYVQIRVSAEVLDPLTGKMAISNVFHFTLLVTDQPPTVIPKTYHEAMMYITGRRHFKCSTNL